MSDRRDDGIDVPGNVAPVGQPVDELTGRPDSHTGFQTRDPKDSSQAFYTTTPPEDRVSSANEGKYEPVEIADPREVTGQFDHLATRDPEAMEHRLQTPEFAGAQTVAGLGVDTSVLNGAVPAGLGVSASLATVADRQGAAADLNPGYTPPSERVAPHVLEGAADLPRGVRAETQNEVQDDRSRD